MASSGHVCPGDIGRLPPVEFFVDIPARQTIIVLTTPVDTSIGFVKILMQDSEGIAFERQRIFLNKKELQDADTIYSIGLRDGNLLQLLNADHPRST